MLAFLHSGHAQILNCNSFVKGKYVEAGINWNGAIGSSVRPPAEYHPDTLSDLFNFSACGGAAVADSGLGFVADPDKDGWSTGSPAYYGDFVLPGGVNEGWSYMSNGIQLNGWNTGAASLDTIAGFSNCYQMGWSDSSGIMKTTWQGVKDGIYLTQITTLDTNQLYLRMDVYIENTSLAPEENIYYMRMINPHNDALLSHSYQTLSKIEYQAPDSLSRVAVSARGAMHNNAYIVMSTQDPTAEGFITLAPGLPTANTIDNIWAMDPANFDYTLGDSITANSSMGIVYNVGTLISGHSALVSFVYGFSRAVVDSVTDSTISVVNVVHPSGAYSAFPNPAANEVKIKGLQPGDAVTFFNLMGQAMTASAVDTSTFNIAAFPPGNYMARITSHDGAVRGHLRIVRS